MRVLSFIQKVVKGEIRLSEVPDIVWTKLRLDLGLPRYSRHYHEKLYAKWGDPFHHEASTFEHTKFRRMLEILPQANFAKILEIGCSVGVFTELLAPRGADILAVDISDGAIRRAKARCQKQPHVRFHQLDLVTGQLMGTFDLVVCSGVLPYLNEIPNRDSICRRLVGWMADGAYLVLVNDARTAGLWPFSQRPQLELVEERRFWDYKQEPCPLEGHETEYVVSLFHKETGQGVVHPSRSWVPMVAQRLDSGVDPKVGGPLSARLWAALIRPPGVGDVRRVVLPLYRKAHSLLGGVESSGLVLLELSTN